MTPCPKQIKLMEMMFFFFSRRRYRRRRGLEHK
jgi:hypothetical protein